VKELWYSHGGCCMSEDKLHLLFVENCAINMVNIVRRYCEVHLFVVHMVFEP